MSKKASNPIPDRAVKPSPPTPPPPIRFSGAADISVVRVYESGVYIGDCQIDRGQYGPYIDLSRVVDPRKAC